MDIEVAGLEFVELIVAGSTKAAALPGGAGEDLACVCCGAAQVYGVLTNRGVIGAECYAKLVCTDEERQVWGRIERALTDAIVRGKSVETLQLEHRDDGSQPRSVFFAAGRSGRPASLGFMRRDYVAEAVAAALAQVHSLDLKICTIV